MSLLSALAFCLHFTIMGIDFSCSQKYGQTVIMLLGGTYEAQTLVGLGVSWCQTRVVFDTDTYNYTNYVILECRRVSVCGSTS